MYYEEQLTLFYFFFLFVSPSIKKKGSIITLCIYTFSMENNIETVVVQRDTTQTKIMSWASHIVRTYYFFLFGKFYLWCTCFIELIVQTLKIEEVY